MSLFSFIPFLNKKEDYKGYTLSNKVDIDLQKSLIDRNRGHEINSITPSDRKASVSPIANSTPAIISSGSNSLEPKLYDRFDPEKEVGKPKTFLQEFGRLGETDVFKEEISGPVRDAIFKDKNVKATAEVIAESSSNVPLRYTASVIDSLEGVFTGVWDDSTEKAWMEARNDPDQSKLSQFLYGVQDSGFQTALGVVLSLIPYAGPVLSAAYWTALSSEEQRGKDRDGDGQPDGEVYSLTNIGIDVALDRLLGDSIGSMLREGPKVGFKGLLKTLNKNGLIESGTEVAQAWLKYGNDYISTDDKEMKARIANEFKEYLQNEMALEFATAYTSGALIAGGGAALSSPNLNAVSQTVNITPENQALIKSGLDEAKQKAGIEPDIVAEGLAEARKNVDQTQDPAIKTALLITQNTTGVISPTEGISTAQNINGHILYNPTSPTIAEDIVGAAFEPVIFNFTNTNEAIEKAYQYEKTDLTKQELAAIKDEMTKRGLMNTGAKAVQRFLKEQIFKSVAYQSIANEEKFSESNPDLYNAFIADVKSENQSKDAALGVKETQRRYSSKNYTVAQAQERFKQDLETYNQTKKFPSKTLKNIYEKVNLAQKLKKQDDYKRTMSKAEMAAREEVRESEIKDSTLTSKLDAITEKTISVADLNNLGLTQAELDITQENFKGKEKIKVSDLKENISQTITQETSEKMLDQLDEAFMDSDISEFAATKEVRERASELIFERLKDKETEDFQLSRIEKLSEESDSLPGDNVRVYYRGAMDEAQVFDLLQRDGDNINFEPVRISEKIEDPIETSDAFSFVSPNIEENLSPETVVENMNSQRHTYIRKMAQDIDKGMGLTAITFNAAGFWGDGQENTLFTLYKNIDTYEDLRYNVALKGLASDQKAVIPFLADENGPDTLYIISFGNETQTDVEKKLTHFGLEYKTIFELNGKTMAAIFDKESGLDENINNLKQYADSIISKKGRGEFLGNKNTWDENTRAGARRIYREVISAYEEGKDMRNNRREQFVPGRPILRREGIHALVVDDVAKNKYELSDDKIVYETENYTVYDIDGKQLIKTKTNLGFEVLEGFDTVEKGLDFIVIEQSNLGDIRDTADYMMANKVINEDLIASNISVKMVIEGKTDISSKQMITMRETTLLKARIRAMAKGARMGWQDARKTLNLAFKVKLDALKDIRAALLQEVKTLSPEDQAKMITRLNSITSENQAAKIERAYIAIRALRNEAERQNLIHTVKKIARNVNKKLKSGTGVNYQYIKMMADLLNEYNVETPSNKTISKLAELKKYLESLGSKEVERADGSIETVYNHPAGIYIPKLAILEKKNISDLTKEELMDLNESLVELWAVGKAVYRKEKSESAERARINYEILMSSVTNMDSTRGDEKTRIFKNEATLTYLSSLHTFRAFNKIDGYQNYNGAAVAWQRRVHQATTRAEDRQNQVVKEVFKEIESIVGKEGRITEQEELAVAFFLYADQTSYDENGQLIANPQAQSIIDNNNLTEPPQRTERVDAIIDLLRDKLESTYDELSEVYTMVENKSFPRLKNYFPYYYDQAGNLTFDPSPNQIRALRKGAKKDFSYSRKKNVKKKIRTDVLSIFTNAMYERLYYIEVQPTLKEMKEMLNHKEVSEDEAGNKTTTTFQDKAGLVTSKYFSEFIDIVANRGKRSGFTNSKIINWMRQNISYAVMGFNLSSALIQPFAIADAALWTGVNRGVGPAVRMVARFSANLLNPKFASRIKSQSAVLRNRQGGEFAFADLSPKITGKGVLGNAAANTVNFMKAHAYDLLRVPDIQTAAIVQDSIYKDLMATVPGITEADARREAEFIMNMVSGSADIADRPLLLGKSNSWRMLLTFQTFILNRFGIMTEDFIMQRLFKSGNVKATMGTLHNIPRKKLSSIMAALIAFFLMSVAEGYEQLFRRFNRKVLYGKDDQKTNFWSDVLTAWAEMIPIFGGAISDVKAGRYVGSSVDVPLLTSLSNLLNGISYLKSDKKETQDKGKLMITKSISTFFGVPGTNFGTNLFSRFMTEQTSSSSSSQQRTIPGGVPRPARPTRPSRPSR